MLERQGMLILFLTQKKQKSAYRFVFDQPVSLTFFTTIVIFLPRGFKVTILLMCYMRYHLTTHAFLKVVLK